MYTIFMKKKDTNEITEVIRLETYDMMKNLVEILRSTTNSDISVELELDELHPFPSNMLDKNKKEYFPSFTGKYVIVQNGIYSGDIIIDEYKKDEDIYNERDSITKANTIEFYAKSNLLSDKSEIFQLVHKNGSIDYNIKKPMIKEAKLLNYGTIYTETDDGPVLFANNLRHKPELDYLSRYNRNYIAHNLHAWNHSGDEYTLSNSIEHIIEAIRQNYGQTFIYLIIDNEVYEPINPSFINCKNAPAIGEYNE